MGRKLDTFVGAAAVAVATFIIVGLLGTTTERLIIKPDTARLKPVYLLITIVLVLQLCAVYMWVVIL